MSIEATKLVTTISGVLSRDVSVEQHKNKNASVQTKDNASQSTNVSLSKNTMTLLQSTQSDIDMEKVNNIKQAITNGSLVINPDKIADELIKQTIADMKC